MKKNKIGSLGKCSFLKKEILEPLTSDQGETKEPSSLLIAIEDVKKKMNQNK
jgi:hypothetical protein